MLAAHLHRLTRRTPVRYAMDPAHLQAIQNYLMLATRGHGVPRMHAGSMDQLGPVYQAAPHAHGAMQSLLESGHPGDLMAYLDAISETGFQPDPMRGDAHRLLDTLRGLHGHIDRPDDNRPGRANRMRDRIIPGFQDVEYQDYEVPGVRDMLDGTRPSPARVHLNPITRLLNLLSQERENLQSPRSSTVAPLQTHLSQRDVMDHLHALNQASGGLFRGRVMPAVQMHDLARGLETNPMAGNARHPAGDLRSSMERLISDHLVPHLLGQ